MRILAALALIALPPAGLAKPPMLPLTCLVVGIADDDTLTARCGEPGEYQQLKVRLAEIDAPEKKQPFGPRSKESLSDLCFQAVATIKPTAIARYGPGGVSV